jgi:hypothetical protein
VGGQQARVEHRVQLAGDVGLLNHLEARAALGVQDAAGDAVAGREEPGGGGDLRVLHQVRVVLLQKEISKSGSQKARKKEYIDRRK